MTLAEISRAIDTYMNTHPYYEIVAALPMRGYNNKLTVNYIVYEDRTELYHVVASHPDGTIKIVSQHDNWPDAARPYTGYID